MELKFIDTFIKGCANNCLNRTFMELKFTGDDDDKAKQRSLNRTFMELKSCENPYTIRDPHGS